MLWVVRAETLLSACPADLAALLARAAEGVGVPVAGVVSDGPHSIRNAVAQARPGVPHQLCPFHDLRAAAGPVYGADRRAKKELKRHVRGVRAIARRVEDPSDPEAEGVRGYGSAVRSAWTDAGHPPLDAAGLRRRDRPAAAAGSPTRVGAGEKGRSENGPGCTGGSRADGRGRPSRSPR